MKETVLCYSREECEAPYGKLPMYTLVETVEMVEMGLLGCLTVASGNSTNSTNSTILCYLYLSATRQMSGCLPI